jgi:hypothetical protein
MNGGRRRFLFALFRSFCCLIAKEDTDLDQNRCPTKSVKTVERGTICPTKRAKTVELEHFVLQKE